MKKIPRYLFPVMVLALAFAAILQDLSRPFPAPAAADVCYDAYDNGVYAHCCLGFCEFIGSGDPNSAVTATSVGDIYHNTTDGTLWRFKGTPRQNTGWWLVQFNALPTPTVTSTP